MITTSDEYTRRGGSTPATIGPEREFVCGEWPSQVPSADKFAMAGVPGERFSSFVPAEWDDHDYWAWGRRRWIGKLRVTTNFAWMKQCDAQDVDVLGLST